MKIKMQGGISAIEYCAGEIGATLENVRVVHGWVQGVFRPTAKTPDKFRKRGHTGRRVHAISFMGHYEIMKAIFKVDPKAIIKSAMATYNGVDEFEEKWRDAGQKNVGSMIQPRRAIDDDKPAPPSPFMRDEERAVTFGTLTENGLVNVRMIKQSDMQKCPHFIMIADHYRPDGTCKCNDREHREMMIREWGYTEKDFAGIPLIN